MSILQHKKINLGEPIEIIIPRDSGIAIIDGETIKVEIVKVYDWYDEVEYLEGFCNKKDDLFQIECENKLCQGLYLILCLKNHEGVVIAGKSHDSTQLLDAFTVKGTSDKSPVDMYQSLVNNRKHLFNLPKNDFENNEASPFDIAIFCKNTNADVRVMYGDIELIPYNQLSLGNEIEYLNAFLSDEGYVLNYDKNKNGSKLPSAVLRIANVFACTDDEAVDFALKKAELINNLFTLMMQGNGSFFAVVVFDKNKQAAQLRPIQPHYVGNLLKWINQGHFIRTYYDAMKDTNTYLKLYIKLLTDAMNEEDQMIKYYRLWIVLEGIAGLKKYDNEVMKKWNGEIVTNKKGDPILIGSESLNIVFELIRRSALFSEEFFKVEKITTPKEFLSICYQRRCCSAHHGSCVLDDPLICNSEKQEMKRCNENRIIHGNPRDVFTDHILWNLQQLTFSIVKQEIEHEFGKVKKEDEIVLDLINDIKFI